LAGSSGAVGAVVSESDAFAQQVRRAVERTCAEQGVPRFVSDRLVLAQVVVLLSGRDAGGRAQARSASTAPAPAGSEAPHWTDTVDSHGSGSDGAGHDLHVVDEGFDDRSLAVEVQIAPLLPKALGVADVGVDVPRAG
jgi:hypothetical protein